MITGGTIRLNKSKRTIHRVPAHEFFFETKMSQHLTKYTELLSFPNILYRFNGVVVSVSDIAAAVAVGGTDAVAIVCAVDLCCSPLIRSICVYIVFELLFSSSKWNSFFYHYNQNQESKRHQKWIAPTKKAKWNKNKDPLVDCYLFRHIIWFHFLLCVCVCVHQKLIEKENNIINIHVFYNIFGPNVP